MPAYSFQQRFVPMVLEGSKRHTIRKRRKYAPKKGDNLQLYYGMRTKWCKKLRVDVCTDVKSILIAINSNTGDPVLVLFDRRLRDDEFEMIDGKIVLHTDVKKTAIEPDERDRFAWADGFRPDGSTANNPAGAWHLMIRWWSKTHDLPFLGDWIAW